MATIALSVAGAAAGSILLPGLGTIAGASIGAMIGGAVGAAAGGFIDSNFLMPAIFGRTNQDFTGPRLDDFQVQTGSEGSPIKFCLGPKTRVSGVVIWASDIIEEVRTTSVGGKGGGTTGGSSTNYSYFVHLDILVCESDTSDPIEAIDKIWADEKVIFERQPDAVVPAPVVSSSIKVSNVRGRLVISGTGFSSLTGLAVGQAVTVSGFNCAGNNGLFFVSGVTSNTLYLSNASGMVLRENDTTIAHSPEQTIISVVSGATRRIRFLTPITFWQPGMRFTMSGWTNAANNTTFTVDSLVDGYTVQVTDNTLVAENKAGITTSVALATVTVTPRGDTYDSRYQDLRFYYGEAAQDPDALKQSIVGAADEPAYRGVCRVVIQKFAMRDWGNRIPQFSFLVRAQSKLTVGQAIDRIFARADLTVPVVTSEVRGTLLGMVIGSQMSVVEMLEPIMLAYNLTVQESEGSLYFMNRGREHTVSVEENDLTAKIGGEETEFRKVQFTDPSNFELPRELQITYFEEEANFLSATQTARRIGSTTVATSSINLPLTLTPTVARNVAQRMLFAGYGGRRKVKLTLPPNYVETEEGDILRMSVDGDDYIVQVNSAEIGSNRMLMIQGTEFEPQIWRSLSETDEAVTPEPPPPYSPPVIQLLLKDAPAFTDAAANTPGYFFAISATVQDATWLGAIGYSSVDDVTYEAVFSTALEATIGTASNTLGDGQLEVWDNANTLTVVLENGTLESKSEAAVMNGSNMAMVGDEVIGFVNATLTSPNTYELSKLLRGLRGTDDKMTGHGANERFILVGAGTGFEEVNNADIATSKYIKGVAAQGNPDGVDAELFTISCRNLKQFSPQHISGTRNGSNDLTVTWQRRSRGTSGFLSVSVPLLHTEEKYQIRVMNASPIKTYTVTGSASWTYTAAQQTTDGLTPGDPVTVEISQAGPLGYGVPKEETV